MRVVHGITVVFCSFLIGCAIVVAPSGGDKDVTPPQVLSSIPANYSANFVEKEIIIEFDEFVKLKDLYNQFIVSPPLGKKPEVLIRGKSVVIKLDEVLPENATVSFNFGNSIVDLHEGNPLIDYRFVVSTGSYVDSLSIRGKVVTASTLEMAKDVWVMMYDCQDYKACDSLPSKIEPHYLTKTNSRGEFNISNIRKGSYKVFGLLDKNRNNLFDLPNESIGFIGELIEAGDSIELKLSMFDQEDGNQKITKVVNVQQGLTKIGFKLPIDDVNITALNFSSKTRWEVVDINSDRDTVYYWNTSGVDSLLLRVTDKRYAFEDTITIGTGRDKEMAPLTISTTTNRTKILDLGKEFQLLSSKPLTIYDNKAIKLFEQIDSVNMEELSFKLDFADEGRRMLNVHHDWKAGASYTLKLEQGALTDFFQNKSDTVNTSFTVREEDFYGNAAIELALSKIEHTYIIQLLDARKKVIREDFVLPSDVLVEGKMKLNYQHVIPGKYRLKVIYDLNNNRRWDTGDHSANKQPERIDFAKEQILIRSNWDLVLDWDLALD